MLTRVSLSIEVPDDTIYGDAKLFVSRWHESRLLYHSQPYHAPAVCQPLEIAQDVYPYAVATLRDVADRAIASCLEHIAKGEVLLMAENTSHQDV